MCGDVVLHAVHLEGGEYSVALLQFLSEARGDFRTRLAETFVGGIGHDAEGLVEKSFFYLRHGVEVLFVDALEGALQGAVVEDEGGANVVIVSIAIKLVDYQSKAPLLCGASAKKEVVRFWGDLSAGCFAATSPCSSEEENEDSPKKLAAFFFSSISAFSCS